MMEVQSKRDFAKPMINSPAVVHNIQGITARASFQDPMDLRDDFCETLLHRDRSPLDGAACKEGRPLASKGIAALSEESRGASAADAALGSSSQVESTPARAKGMDSRPFSALTSETRGVPDHSSGDSSRC